MDIYKLRNSIHVTIYYNISGNATILYTLNGSTNVIKLDKQPLIDELTAIGSIDEINTWGDLFNYPLSQWDALNIAIRFEQAREMDKEIENSDIGKAINKLKQTSNGQGDAY